jgi:hypothetical protein
MAKRRSGGGGGSSMGLIMTLVFFILTTITLGVTTYMGYSEIKEHDTKAKEATKAKETADKERDWYKFQARVVREIDGHPEKIDDAAHTVLAQDVAEFVQTGNVSRKFGPSPPGKEDFKAYLDTVKKTLPWNAPNELSPSKTFVTLVAEKDKTIANANTNAERSQKAKDDAEEEKARIQKKLDESDKLFKDAIDKAKTSANTDRDKDRAEILSLSTSLDKENKRAAKLQGDLAGLTQQKTDLEVKLKALEGKLTVESRERNKAESQREDLKTRLTEAEKRIRDEDKTAADKALDAEAIKELNNWHKNPAKMKWKITYVDQKGQMPYINLGSGDGLETQMTFSVHSLGRDGKLSPVPKGTVEVVQLVPNQRHLARVRITSQTDAKNDPIVVGDQLFNPTWGGPGQAKRVAIAGLADLGGEGTEDSADLRRLLKRQGVIVDAYVATKNLKAPEVLNDKGEKGDVTSKTNFLIVGDGLLEAIPSHSKKLDKEFIKAVNDQIGAMRSKATSNGITVISLSRYLEMIGYRPSKVTSSR